MASSSSEQVVWQAECLAPSSRMQLCRGGDRLTSSSENPGPLPRPSNPTTPIVWTLPLRKDHHEKRKLITTICLRSPPNRTPHQTQVLPFEKHITIYVCMYVIGKVFKFRPPHTPIQTDTYVKTTRDKSFVKRENARVLFFFYLNKRPLKKDNLNEYHGKQLCTSQKQIRLRRSELREGFCFIGQHFSGRFFLF